MPMQDSCIWAILRCLLGFRKFESEEAPVITVYCERVVIMMYYYTDTSWLLRTILFIRDICKHLHSYLLTLVQWVVSLQA